MALQDKKAEIAAAARIFAVDTRFQRLARRPDGVSRKHAIALAQRHLDELKSEFAVWLDQKMKDLAGSLLQFADNSRDRPALERAYGLCCELRDVGTTMGFELISSVAESFCDILEACKAGAPYDKAKIDRHLDELSLARMHPNVMNIDQPVGRNVH